MVTFTIGCDPEVFLTKSGKPVSAHGLIEGTKRSPQKTSHGAVQVDGTALEFNTVPVELSNYDAFNLNVVKTIDDMKKLVSGYSISKVSVQDYPEEYIKSLPHEALELGCDPDYNAYTGEKNPRPDGERSFRSGAGHIHLGWGQDIPVDNEEHIEICRGIVKMLDATVGMFMTYIDREPRRRELYGKAGAFRPKSYGVEYRTPSNAWIWNRDRRNLVQMLAQYAVNRQTGGYTPMHIAGMVTEEDIARCINDGDWKLAAERLENHCWWSGSMRKVWVRIQQQMAGIDTKDPIADIGDNF